MILFSIKRKNSIFPKIQVSDYSLFYYHPINGFEFQGEEIEWQQEN